MVENSKLTEHALEQAREMFFAGIRSIKASALGSKSHKRCFEFACNDGLTNKKIKLKNDAEEVLAYKYQIVLESMIILKAGQLNFLSDIKPDQEKEKEDGGQANG